MSLDNIQLWHERARPEPSGTNLDVQLGCHIEEFCEMLDVLEFRATWYNMRVYLKQLANDLKSGAESAAIIDRKEMLDALADQVVTSVGVGHCAEMDVPAACARVNVSNWSKYDEQGQPIFKPNGKIDKGPGYVKPNLSGLY